MSTENQALKPLNDVAQTTVKENSTIINLDLCQWRYPKRVITTFNDYQTKKNRKYKMSYKLTEWQNSDSILN